MSTLAYERSATLVPMPLAADAPLHGDRRREAEAGILAVEHAIVGHRYEHALAALAARRGEWSPYPELVLRALFAESWARMYTGRIAEAIVVAERARGLAAQPSFTDVDRADALFRLGCCRYKLSQIAAATSLFTLALELSERSGRPTDRLRAQILRWRSCCHRRNRELDAARADAEKALELAEGVGDRRTTADAYVQASLVAERSGDTLMARFYAEAARSIYDEFADTLNVARMLNNLGGINFLLGDTAEAVANLTESHRLATEHGSSVDAAHAVSSLAQVRLRSGEFRGAETHARHAIELLGGRVDLTYELGNAQLVLGRALLEQDRLDEADLVFQAGEASMASLGSASHRAAAWIARGDLAARRHDTLGAAALYKRAAESLQDMHF